MKLFIKLAILVLILGIAGPFFLKGPDGKPYLDFREFVPNLSGIKRTAQNVVGDLQDVANDVSGSDSPNTFGKTKVYKWQDEQGNWQYSDRPPTNGAESETLLINPNVNLTEGTPIPEVIEEEPAEQAPQIDVPLPLTISPDKVDKLKQDAQKVQDLMNERSKTLESL